MRIISDSHDYYDGVQAHGQDQSLVYLRRPEVVEYAPPATWNAPRPYPLFVGPKGYFNSIAGKVHTIGFCGRVHLCIEKTPKAPDGTVLPSHFCYSLDDVDAYVREHYPKKFDAYASSAKNWRRWRGRGWDYGNRRDNHAELFDECAKHQDDFAELFEAKRSPVFVGTASTEWKVKDRIAYNAILKPYHFQRIRDPFAAFQEISMFLGNLAWPDKPMLQMTNDENAARLGHGDRYSFRRAPSKR